MANAWVAAARPTTLWAAFAPVLVGTAAAYNSGCFRLAPALAALFGALWIQVGTNFANDLFDFQKGADNDARLGPLRAVQAGAITPRAMAMATGLAFALAALSGVYLIWVAGPWIAALGLASILAGLAYTGGPYPLGYHGLGDLFVFVFFGMVAVAGTAFVQCSRVPTTAWTAAVALGCLSTAILVVNNLRDRVSDRAAGKKTLAVILGARATRVEYALLVAIAFSIPLVGFFRWLDSPDGIRWQASWLALPWLAAPMAALLVRRVWLEDGVALNRSLGGTARLLLAFSVLYSISLVATTSMAAPAAS